MTGTCPPDNQPDVDQSSFWTSSGLNWDQHRIGWAIAGACAALTVIISSISVFRHCRNYTNPSQQRQILRIIYMPPVYAIIAFLSYRFFRNYTYYDLVEVSYEAVTISAFLLLLIDYVAATSSDHSAEKAIERKDKRPLPIPFCCFRYRPTKAYFMYTLKWAVLQYVIIRPACSLVGIICQALNVLCQSEGLNPKYADLYIEIINFISITIALYALFVFYFLTKDELTGKRPFAKFAAIKLIVFLTFYQSLLLSGLQKNVIKGSKFWTPTNVANGINALAICIEMVFFSAFMLWAYPSSEYTRQPGTKVPGFWKPLWDSINYSDFVLEIWYSLKFFVDYVRGKPTAHGHGHRVPDFGEAFGVDGQRGPNDAQPREREDMELGNPRISGSSRSLVESYHEEQGVAK